MAGSADIGIRVFLDDAASQALGAINSSLARMVSTTQTASRAMGGLSGSMAAVGVAVGLAAAFLAFGAAIKYSVDAASAFQQAMFSVAVATHVPLDAAMQYSSVLMNLAASSTYTSAEIADGIVQMGRAGFSIHDIFTQMAQSGAGFVNVGGQMVPVMSSMAQAGIALGIATRSTAVQGFTLLTQAMAAYRAPAADALQYANLLQFAFEHQRGSVADLTAGLSQVTPIASALGVPFREVVAALDVLGPAMKSTSIAGTALRYMISGLYTPTAGAQAEMIALKLATVDAQGNFHSAFYDAKGNAVDFDTALHILSDHLKGMSQEAKLAALKDLFSTRGGQGALDLINNIDKVDAYLKQLKDNGDNANGAMSRWQQVMGTLAGATAGLRSSITDLAVVIGQQFLPVLTDIATRANGFITAIRGMAAANPAATSSFLQLGLAMSGVGLVATIVALAFASVATGIMIFIGIVLGVIAGVVLLTVGIMLLANWFRNLYASSALVRSIIGNLGAVFNEVGAAARDAFAQALETVSEVLAQTHFKMSDLIVILKVLLVVIATVAALLLGVLVASLRGVILALAMFAAGLLLVIAGVGQFVAGVLQLFKGMFDVIIGLVTGNGAMVTHGFALMRDGSLNIIRGLVTALIGLFIGVFGTIIGFIVGFVQGIISWFQHLSAVLVGHSIVPDMLNAIRNDFISILSGIVGWIAGWVGSIIAAFARMGSSVVSTVVSAWNAVRSAIMSAMASIVSVVVSAAASVVSRFISMGASVVAAVSSAFNSVRSVVLSAAAAVLAAILSMGASVVSAVTSAFNSARAAAASALAGMVAVVSSGAAAMVGRIVALGASIVSTASSAMASFRGAVSSGMAAAAGAVSSGVAQIIGVVSSLPGQLYSWGARAMSSFAAGLQSALGAVVGAVESAASSVANFLGHLSPAKMGPLAQDDKWMPNMMNMFANQIESHAPLLQNALSKATAGMASVPQMTRLGAPNIGAGGGGVVGGGGGGGGTYTVQLVVDGRVLTQVVMNNLSGQLQLNGAGRAFR